MCAHADQNFQSKRANEDGEGFCCSGRQSGGG
jgi:hypothetical protein